MTDFPETSTTLLARLSCAGESIDNAAWQRFFELYQPVMLQFIRNRCKKMGRPEICEDAEDIAQRVLVSVIGVFNSGKYNREKGKFRAYLVTILKNNLADWLRHAQARPRGAGAIVSIEELPAFQNSIFSREDEEEWRHARHMAAIEHVLEKTAISAQSRMIYREILATGENCAVIARRLGIPAATVRQVKSRVSRMIKAFEKNTM